VGLNKGVMVSLLTTMAKEKVQNKVQTIQWQKKKYNIKYRQSNGQRESTK
jgi:hypothetical protein